MSNISKKRKDPPNQIIDLKPKVKTSKPSPSIPAKSNTANELLGKVINPLDKPSFNNSNGHTPLDVESVERPKPIWNNKHWYPVNLVEIIKYIIIQPQKEMKSPEFDFELSRKAAKHNWRIINEKYKGDYVKAIESQHDTQLTYGSEFRDPALLELIFERHPLWPRMKEQLEHGATYPLEPLDKISIEKDKIEALERGNHKGVINNPKLFTEIMDEEVRQGWQLVIEKENIIDLEGAQLAPMNIQDQRTIDDDGNVIPKKRLSHDQSFAYGSGTSVNSRIIEEELQDVMYGSCLSRVIHDIIMLRLKFPSTRILMSKIDYKGAYRRGHLHASSSLVTATQSEELNLVFLALRMTFGGAGNPSFWGNIAEPIADLSNALFQCSDWDYKTTFSPIQHKLPPIQENNNDDYFFAKALPLAFKFERDDNPKCDLYIDDNLSKCVDIDDNAERTSKAVLLATHIIGRPFNENDPLIRKDLVSFSKLSAEGALEEEKIFLGWNLNTRDLLINLPFHKYKAWTTDINEIVCEKKGKTTASELESLIGRLGHVSQCIQNMKHFMNRLRDELARAKKRRSIKLSSESIEDLKLHKFFIEKAHRGINLNLLTLRLPDRAYRADACPFGIGGYSSEGRAWRWYIPQNLQFRATLNMLEFIASTIGEWIDILEENMAPLTCTISLTDSTTSAGWLHKTSFTFNEKEPKELTKAKCSIARGHAKRLFDAQVLQFQQHFPGEHNIIADSLSRDDHLTDDELTHLFLSKYPKQVPKNFKISPLPAEIISFLFSMLQTIPEANQSVERHKRSNIEVGSGGTNSLQRSISAKIPSWSIFNNGIETSCSLHSEKQSDKENLLKEMAAPWFQEPSAPPWTMYVRPSESTINQTQNWMGINSLQEFYKNSSKAVKKMINQSDKKKQSH